MKIENQKYRFYCGWALTIGIAALVAALFHTALIETWNAWQTEEYSHGYLVPFIGVMLVLYRATQVTDVPRNNSWLGVLGVALTLILLMLFNMAGIMGIQPVLFVAFIMALFITFNGVRYSMALLPALAFFLFLVPLPKFLYYTISFNMQMISTDLSVVMLKMAGISVFQEGNIIDLGIMQMEVAEACNGLRYLFPLMALGYLLAFMYQAPLWKRALLFLSTIPITILLNSVRIFFIGLSANWWGPEVASGIVHDAEGWVVFLACFILLIIEIYILRLFGTDERINYDVLSFPSGASLHAFKQFHFGNPAKASLFIMLIATVAHLFIGVAGLNRVQPIYLSQPLNQFPTQINTWIGRPQRMDAQSLEVLGTHDYFLGDYRTLNGDVVNLYMLYYPKQDSTSNQAIHTPEVCIPGGGWVIQSHEIMDIKDSRGFIRKVNRLIIAKGIERQLVYYWFYQGENMTVNTVSARLSIIRRALFEGKANGGMVRLVTVIGRDEGDEAIAEERLRSFFADSDKTIYQRLYQQ